MFAVGLGYTVIFVVIMLSQPATEMSVSLYVPPVFTTVPPGKVYVTPEQILTDWLAKVPDATVTVALTVPEHAPVETIMEYVVVADGVI